MVVSVEQRMDFSHPIGDSVVFLTNYLIDKIIELIVIVESQIGLPLLRESRFKATKYVFLWRI